MFVSACTKTDADTADATTPAAPATAAPSPTTPAPLSPAALTLLSDGIGPLRFGTPEPDVLAALSSVLGAPVTTSATAYPIRSTWS